jgi:putative ABC transport system permease protein
VAVFSLIVMAVTGLLAGITPAVRSARQDVAITLRDDRRSSPTGRGTVRLRNALVAIQVGASLVLILGAGLLSRSLAALQNLDTGVDAGRVAWVRTSLAQTGVADGAAATFIEELRLRMEAVPGATRAAVASRLPAQGAGSTTTIVEGYTPPNGTGAIELPFTVVSPEYFETVGLSVLNGRGFEATDAQGGDRVILINEAAARTFWGGADPIGRRLRSQAQPDLYRTVIGVVADAPVNNLSEPIRPMFYMPAAQSGLGSFYLLVRSDVDPEALLRSIREEMQSFRATLPVLTQGTLASHFSATLAGPRFAARLMGGISLLAMILAGLGTYAVVAFGVARRAAEMGIRMALGAEQGRVVRMVVGETAGTVLLGLGVGMAIAFVAAPRLEPLLFGVAALDPITFGGAILLLAGVAALAAYIPARRAAQADPARSLRTS